ncbi:hypothetical protein FA13DRAFT_1737630 [Coprinellus micaceus]|uniref:Uncharacterized protein n=1 Tax=Coprinellus micaceus TaxID=71717 RepID=A0A4Y7SX55_COPMI|nr:hypothetical protein FA13DRAFT_1737630 [Coprinellus micaceus]
MHGTRIYTSPQYNEYQGNLNTPRFRGCTKLFEHCRLNESLSAQVGVPIGGTNGHESKVSPNRWT